MTRDDLLPRLENVRRRGGRDVASCPAHPDKNPSLQITEGQKGLLLRCWAGCSVMEICKSLGIDQRDLFYDACDSAARGQRPTPKPPKLDRAALMWRYELAALDLRLRAERIVEAGKQLDVASLSDDERDRAIAHVAQVHIDVERAELFEHVADTLRERDFTERNTRARQTRVA
ncbi:MAG: hypothetical protein ND866_08045 [Pyrinomonadaceae bacterium]|nr:hypothetical protein [Pyrinomonadaceae bacterium]